MCRQKWWKSWLHRCWCRMLETKCVGDNFKMLVTILIMLVTNILYLLTSKRCHQDLNSVANILKLSPTVSHQHHNVTNMTVAENLTWIFSITFGIVVLMFGLVGGKCLIQYWCNIRFFVRFFFAKSPTVYLWLYTWSNVQSWYHEI